MVEIFTNRLHLRPFVANDLDAYHAMVSDPEVMQFLGTGDTLGRGAAWDQIALILGHWQLRGYGPFAVTERASGAFVGRVGFYHPDDWPGMEASWALCRNHWGKNYATEAAQAALDWGFGTQQVDQIVSCIQAANTRSIAVAKRIGERHRQTTTLRGNNTQIWAIDRADWITQRQAGGRD